MVWTASARSLARLEILQQLTGKLFMVQKILQHCRIERVIGWITGLVMSVFCAIADPAIVDRPQWTIRTQFWVHIILYS